MKRTATIFLAATALIAVSCRQHGVELMNPNTVLYTKPSEQFEAIWHGINNSYAFWDIDPTNWDSLYSVYSPRFSELDELDEAGNYIATETLRQHYTDMCGTLSITTCAYSSAICGKTPTTPPTTEL